MGVILDGYFDSGIFYSDDMLVKHDNEYISEDGEVYNVENYKEWYLQLELFWLGLVFWTWSWCAFQIKKIYFKLL